MNKNFSEEIEAELRSRYDSKEFFFNWVFYIRRFLKQQSDSNDSSALVFTKSEIKAMSSTRVSLNVRISVLVKALANDNFIKFVIAEIGHEQMNEIVWKLGSVDVDYFADKYEENVYQSKGYYQRFTAKYAIFETSYAYRDPDYLQFAKVINNRFREFFTPPKTYFPVSTPAKDIDTLVKSNFENDIFELIPRIAYNLRLGILKRGKSGNFLKSGLNTLRKEVKFDEVFPEQLLKKTSDFSLQAIIELVDRNLHDLDENDTLSNIRKIIYSVVEDDEFVFDHIMKLYRGNKNEVFLEADYTAFFEALKSHDATGDWHNTKNFLHYCYYRDCMLEPRLGGYINLFLPLFSSSFIERMEIEDNNVFEFVVKQFQSGFLYVLASFGLIETLSNFGKARYDVIVRHHKAAVIIPYNSLMYFRLTKLGRYIFGVEDSYDTPISDFQPTEMLLSDSSLTINLSKSDIAITKELSGYTKQLGAKLFQVTKMSFLSKIENREQLFNRIEHFKSMTTKDLPSIWIEFFDSLDQIFDPLERIRKAVLLYKVPAHNTQLIEDLRNDIELRDLYIKAEKRQILIFKENYNKFETRMKQLGWILEK